MEEGDAAQRVPELRLDNVPMLSIVSPSKLEEGFKPKPHPVRPSTSDAQCMCHDTLLTDKAPLPAAACGATTMGVSSISSPSATKPSGGCAEHLLHRQENFVRRSGRAGAVGIRSIVRLRCPCWARRSRRHCVLVCAMRDVALTRMCVLCWKSARQVADAHVLAERVGAAAVGWMRRRCLQRRRRLLRLFQMLLRRLRQGGGRRTCRLELDAQ